MRKIETWLVLSFSLIFIFPGTGLSQTSPSTANPTATPAAPTPAYPVVPSEPTRIGNTPSGGLPDTKEKARPKLNGDVLYSDQVPGKNSDNKEFEKVEVHTGWVGDFNLKQVNLRVEGKTYVIPRSYFKGRDLLPGKKTTVELPVGKLQSFEKTEKRKWIRRQ